MEFPQDIWDEIMSNFPSVYREPSHYVAITEVNAFNFIRECRRIRQRLPQISRIQNSPLFDSYYMALVQSTEGNRTTPKVIHRGVAHLSIRHEFEEIFRMYREKHNTNSLGFLRY